MNEVQKERSKNLTPTKLGLLPVDWHLARLRRVAQVIPSNVDKKIKEHELQVLLCNYVDVYHNDYIFSGLRFSLGTVKQSELEKFQLRKGDVIITKDSEDRSDIAIPAYVLEEVNGLVCGYHLIILRPTKGTLEGMFLKFALELNEVNHHFRRRANGVTRFGLTTDTVRNSYLPLPPLPEQKKIAEILGSWDEAIAKTQELIAQLKKRNKGLAQQLLTGKKRLPGFNGEWDQLNFNDIAERITRRNDELDDTVVTISAQRGFVKQEDFFKKRVASSTLSNYYLLHKGEFAYNKSYSNGYPMGAFKRLDDFDKAVVTTLYICFDLKDGVSSNFMTQFFENGQLIPNLMQIAQEGGRAHGLLNIGISDFFALKLTIPLLEEQKAIASVLEEADRELKLTEQKLTTLKTQKKGLMQRLLTGEVRVKLNSV